ncbi:ABC transporter ATP-binding protein [Chloroflexales bacterium ZM16-3]|nr:ABC transporter ATP-binding protein [Chloroflexales bacterium ZM16-3]
MSNLRHLLPYMARYRIMLIVGILCAAVGAGVSALGPYLLRLAVDAISAGGAQVQRLLVFGGLIILVALVDGAFKFAQRMLIATASYKVEYDLRGDLFRRYLSLDQGFFGRNHTGDLMARATNDLSAVRQFLGAGLNGTSTAVLTFVAAAILMLGINLQLALVVLLLMPLSTLVFVVVGGRMRKIFTSVQDQFGNISTRAQENFSGIRTIKAYAQEDAEIAVFAEDNARYRRLNLRYVLLSGALWPSMSLALGSVAALVLLVGGRLVASGELTIGELVQFNAYLGLLAFPMIMLGWMVSLYQQAAASMGRLIAVLRQEPEIASSHAALPLPAPRGEIVFRAVGIRYEAATPDPHPATPDSRLPTPDSQPSEWLLEDISFTIPAGTSLAIVGATGVGKTTLVHLLGRVRDPDAGEVLFDGANVRDIDLADLRRAIAYVPQETFLFSVPLRENVGFGLGDSADNQLLDHAVQVSRLSNDLAQFPDGLDTMVGERGVTLSGGQKQRVAIARALTRDPAVLILDDAMSSVDTHTAAQILAGLREVMRGRTSIIIAQRIATVKDANQIILLDGGRVVERGTHHELLRLGGRYAAMYRRELLESELSE